MGNFLDIYDTFEDLNNNVKGDYESSFIEDYILPVYCEHRQVRKLDHEQSVARCIEIYGMNGRDKENLEKIIAIGDYNHE